jgi:flagellar protein FlbD
MIALHRLNKAEFMLNADLIETIEATPDTMITLTTGKKLIVRDGIGDVVDRIVHFRRLCNGTIKVIAEVKDNDPRAGMPPDAGA